MELVKLVAIFVLILLMIQRKINLGIAMTIGSVLMAFFYHMTFLETIETIMVALTNTSTLQTSAALIFIMILEYLMRQRKMLETIVDSLNYLIRDYRLVMPVPAVFMGLLPSAGGALFSASMVANACGDHSMSAERKGVINFWYRHVWECVLPLYPSLIIASEIMGVPMNQFIRNTYPFTVMAILLGCPYLFYHMKKDFRSLPKEVEIASESQKIKRVGELLKGISPILAILLLFFIAGLPLWISLLLVITPMFLSLRIPLAKIPAFLKESVSAKIILILAGVMIFKEMLEASGAVTILVEQMMEWGIPLVLLCMLLPFSIGFFTGLSHAFVAIAFPILLGMMTEIDLTLMALAHVSGFAGIMLSPMHLCLVLTADFFSAKMGKMMAMMIPPLFFMIGVGLFLV